MSIIIVLISFLIPLYCLLRKKHDYLVFWIAAVTILDIFNSQQFLNLSAFKITGLCVFPYLIFHRNNFIRNRSFHYLAIFIVLLGVIGFYYGFLSPWPDVIGIRASKDLPPIRPILHLGSLGLELSTTLYLTLQFERSSVLIDKFFKVTLIALCFTCFGALLENLFLFDFYKFFTGGSALKIDGIRLRGFSYEPRGLSQSTAVGILLMTIYFTKIPKKILLIFIPFCLYFGFAKTMSAAGIATMVMGLTLILFSSLFLNGRKYFHSLQIKIVAITILILPLVFLTLTGDSKSQFKKHMQNRSYLLKGTSLIDRLEDQESSALNFLLSSPKAFFLGAGPGMVYLPASKYRVKKFEVENPLGAKNLFNVLPHMGMILQLSNGGLLSFSLLTVLFLFLLQKMVIRKDIIPTHHIVLFILFSGLYLFQVRLIYYTAIAIGMSYNLGKKKG